MNGWTTPPDYGTAVRAFTCPWTSHVRLPAGAQPFVVRAERTLVWWQPRRRSMHHSWFMECWLEQYSVKKTKDLFTNWLLPPPPRTIVVEPVGVGALKPLETSDGGATGCSMAETRVSIPAIRFTRTDSWLDITLRVVVKSGRLGAFSAGAAVSVVGRTGLLETLSVCFLANKNGQVKTVARFWLLNSLRLRLVSFYIITPHWKHIPI